MQSITSGARPITSLTPYVDKHKLASQEFTLSEDGRFRDKSGSDITQSIIDVLKDTDDKRYTDTMTKFFETLFDCDRKPDSPFFDDSIQSIFNSMINSGKITLPVLPHSVNEALARMGITLKRNFDGTIAMIGHAVLPIVEEYAPRFAKRIYWSPVLPSPVNGAVHRRIDDTLKDFGLCKSLTREIAEYVPQPKMTRPQYLLEGPSWEVTAQQFEEAVQAGSEQRLIGELSTLLTDRFGDKGSDVLENVNFERLNLSGIVLKNIKITGGKFFEADLSNAKLDTVNFIGCDMRGVNWSGVVTKNVIVKDCQLDSGHAVPKSLTLADPSPVIPKKTSCLTM